MVAILIANIVLYTFFAIICILQAKIKGGGITVLNKVYKGIIAAIAFVVVILAWVFGAIFIVKVLRGERVNKGNKNTYIKAKISVVLITTSLALVLQIIYLLYTTFAKFPSIAFSVAVYFLVEM